MSINLRPLLIGTALLLLFIQGCTTAPTPGGPEIPDAADRPGRELSEVEQLLLQAETSAPLARAEYTLLAAERLAEQNQHNQAENLLNELNVLLLSEPQQQRLRLLRAETALAGGDSQSARQWLEQIGVPDQLPDPLYRRWAQLRTAIEQRTGDDRSAALALIDQSASLPLDRQTTLNRRIWSALERLGEKTLAELVARENNSYLQQGWLELGLLARRQTADVRLRNEALDSWLTLWDLHPAAAELPPELEILRSNRPLPATHIAVLLPQSGNLAAPAAAITEGLLAAHYQRRQQGHPVPQLSFYDSERIDDLAAFYAQARAASVDLVIGPLDKSLMSQLIPQAILDIPTLALNYAEQETGALNLYQLGLRGEDEARQAAQRAWADGHRIALSLTPDTGWGIRIATAFREAWQQLGGTLAAEQHFTGDNDFSDKISQLLNVDQSEARHQALLELVTEPLEFEARRRQDADFLFLSALTRDARQIKPTLAFHYASNLPVYATSHLYDGVEDPLKNQDLDDILFSDIPWMLDDENPLRASLQLHRDNVHSRFGKLYALGADAYRVAPYLTQLQALPDSHLQGQTGRLQVDPQGRLIRHLEWARFQNGRVQKLP